MISSEIDVKILAVDDIPAKLSALTAILDEPGQTVVCAQSGRDALRRLLQDDFAVILLDVNMPDIDGFETAALIRERKRSEGTPIIFVTADCDENHARRGYSLGAVDYILAPIIPDVLRAKVGVFVDLYRKNQQLRHQMDERVTLAREQAARAAAEESTRRSQFLAEASRVLSRSLDHDATVEGLLRLLVPAMADLVALTTLDGQCQATLHDVAWSDGGDLHRSHLEDAALPRSLAASIQAVALSGRGPQVASVRADELTALADSGTSPLEALTTHSVPLVARGRAIGVLTLGIAPARRPPLTEIALIEDVAGRAAIALDNARLYREINEGNRRKDEFLAMLGHELRNPLAAMTNALDCVEYLHDDPASLHASQQVLSRQVRQMARLVDDLLDVSRITRGRVELRKEVIGLSDAVARAVAAVGPSLEARGHSLEVSLPERPVLLHADPARIEQIFVNLLNNAIKYTEAGGRIQFDARTQAGEVAIQIRDNGIGMSPELIAQIFDLFVQGDRSLDRSQGGLGIGLTLVRSLVELHGGKITATSGGPSLGSEFTVLLPRLVEAAAKAPAVEPAVQPATDPTSGRRVLVVDDNVDLAHTSATLLRAAGHEVWTAHDGHEALDCAERYQPDALLIDIGLPGLDGYEVARRLRQMEAFRKALIVAISGYGQEEDRRRSHAAGFDRHLVKPVGFNDLKQIFAAEVPLVASR